MGDETRDIFKEEKKSLFPTPRPFQDKAHEMLREGVVAGHKKQILCSATGAGKTYLGLRIISEAVKKNRRAWFVCDRTTLIQQTSATADRYGLPHGIIQADHWRKNGELFQIASAQTLARRGNLHLPEILVIDECHGQMRAWTDIINNDKDNKIFAVGLSATPFSKGLGKLFSNFVQAATMEQLTNDGILVPMRVFSCRSPDMTGAETSGGEWTPRAAEKAEMILVGDVVSEWVRLGENRKTIVFGSTIAHCEELCRQFNEAGILASLYTSKTDEDSRKDILEEFSDDESPLRVLISVEALCVDSETEILTKRGWASMDDISMDDEVASYSIYSEKITFDRPISITIRDRFENERMISRASSRLNFRVTEDHSMVVPLGEKWLKRWQTRSAISCYGTNGIDAPVAGYAQEFRTPIQQDPPQSLASSSRRIIANSWVLRKAGMPWQEARDEAERRAACRDSMKYKNPWELTDDECRLIGFWLGDGSCSKGNKGGHIYALCQSMRYDYIVKWVDDLLDRLDLKAFRGVTKKENIKKGTADFVRWSMARGTGFGPQKRSGVYAIEPYLQKNGSLLYWGLSVGQFHALLEGFNYADGHHRGDGFDKLWAFSISNTNKKLLDLLQAIAVCRGMRASVFKQNNKSKDGRGYKDLYMLTINRHRRNITNIFKHAVIEDEFINEKVWCAETVNGTLVTRRNGRVLITGNCKGFDRPSVSCIVDARPLRKSLSTAIQMWGRGLRAYEAGQKKDCILLDVSGNVIRFWSDYEDFYYNGLRSLDAGEKLDGEVRKDGDEQREERACPQCGHRPFVKRCVACGHESKSLSLIQHQPGEMVEITIGREKRKAADSPEHLWAQLATYVRQSGKVETQRQRAFYLYRDIMGRSPPEHFAVGNAPVVDITPAVIGKIRSRQIAYSKGMQKGARRA